jgi:hypothetical protein
MLLRGYLALGLCRFFGTEKLTEVLLSLCMSNFPGKKICAASSSNSRLFRLFRYLFLCPSSLFPIFFSNPAQPILQTKGLLQSPSSWYCLRIGYASDHLYHQSYHDESQPFAFPSVHTCFITDASIVTLNFHNRLDLNLLVGSSQMQIDRDVFAKREFSWAAGAKLLIYDSDLLYCGIDLKYFESQQKPLYFMSDGIAYNILSHFKLSYTEIQGAFGIAVRSTWLVPYGYGTYVYSKIDPTPWTLVLKSPFSHSSFDTTARPFVDARRWGMALGATLLGGTEGSLTVETRFFNQNAVTVTGEIRF